MAAALAEIERALKALPVEQLKLLLHDEAEFDSYFEKHTPMLSEKQQLVAQIKQANIDLAHHNIRDEIALNQLEEEVDGLRQAVVARQAALRPQIEKVQTKLAEDPRAPVMERMQEAADEAHGAARELVEAGSGGDWNAFVAELTKRRRTHHYRLQLVERLEHTVP